MPTSSLTELSAVTLRRLIGRKEISPVALLEDAIARIEALNPAVNAIAAKDYARARAEAKAAEAAVLRGEPLGPLHGLPVGIKDLEETAGLLTTHGSPLYRDHVPETDDGSVANVRAAGGIVLAKTNVPEFGAGANTRNAVFGATGNPFDPSLNAGGSSGGSAVALATDMLPLCSGSDMGGSLRIPAALCGVVGFRPSPGLVPMETRQLGWTPLSVVGPMARDVADVRLLLSAQIGVDPRDPLSVPLDPEAARHARPVDLSRLRVAWTPDFGGAPMSAGIAQTLRARMGRMASLFAACDEIALDFSGADEIFDVVRALSFVARHEEAYRLDPDRLGPNVRANYEMGAALSLADAARAHAAQTALYRRFQAATRDYDLVIGPVTPVSPFPWTRLYLEELEGARLRNYYHWLAPTYYITLVTNPAIALPCGLDPQGMPFGLQVVGRVRGDVALLDAAQALEEALGTMEGMGRPRPDLDRLAAPGPDLTAIVTAPPPDDLAG
jgi:amidase